VLALARPRPPHHEKRRHYAILKGREGESGQWLINYDFNGMNFDEVTADPEQQEPSSTIDY
jgi:hypothetical protein